MIIGLTQRTLLHKGAVYDATDQRWYTFLTEHQLVLIPNTMDQDFARLTEELDCVIITGGDDSAVRRATELKLAATMMMSYKPILGICHGAFLLTDVLGGQVFPIDGHLDCTHEIDYQGRKIQVNSYHNQGIVRTHSTAKTLAQDSQGNTEAWIDGGMAGIVWHPERMSEPFIPAEIQQIMKL